MKDKNYRELLWNIIEESKMDSDFKSEKQFRKLKEILKQYSDDEIQLLEKEWDDINKFYRTFHEGQYELLHYENGGVVHGCDSTFYEDFSEWLVAQGKDLYESYKERGISSILSYIINNNISEEDYEYESMIYAFLKDDEEYNLKNLLIREVDFEELQNEITFKRFSKSLEKLIKENEINENKLGVIEEFITYMKRSVTNIEDVNEEGRKLIDTIYERIFRILGKK